jgi:hypothetical protein
MVGRAPAGSPASTAGHEGGQGEVLRDQKFTRSPPVRSVWSEEGRRGPIRWRQTSGPAGKRRRTAAIPGAAARFLRRGHIGRRAGASWHVGGARGRRKWQGSAVAGARFLARREKRERAREKGGKGRGSIMALLGGSRRSPRPPDGKQEMACRARALGHAAA